MNTIENIVNMLNIPDEYIEYFGKYKAKISNEYYERIKGNKTSKLILVTSINPTPYGEGKTTQSIGIAMGMKKINKNAMLVLREPSLGPVFGIKGGAIGGGKAIIEPKEDINLHFTGDFHAITSANNLLCAVIENSIFYENPFNIDKNNICIKRAMDMNDRGLRNITVGKNSKSGKVEYDTGFEITAACELMAICCLAETKEELKNMIDNMIIAYTSDLKPIYVKSFNVTGAMIQLLKDAIKPNLVQTLEGNPCIVHLGPFANIAHGCNSLIATRLAMKLADYTIVEAGFGADLGAEKFLDIKCRKAKLIPDLAVIVVTVKALKYNGFSKDLKSEDINALEKGIVNLKRHVENIKKYNLPIIVCINKFDTDTDKEINFVKQYCINLGVKCEISYAFEKGSEGTIDLCNLICKTIDEEKPNFKYLYDDNDSIKIKIEKICKNIYGAKEIKYLHEAEEKIKNSKMFSKLPICIAKTPLSLTDDPKMLGDVKNFTITIRDIKISNGAGFIVAYAGEIMTMPGLGKKSKYEEYS